MEWVETTGRTVEEAKNAALEMLGVDVDDAEFEIVEEPKPGLFGRTRGEARVRARVRPTQVRPKTERRDRRRSGGKTEGGRNEGSRNRNHASQNKAGPDIQNAIGNRLAHAFEHDHGRPAGNDCQRGSISRLAGGSTMSRYSPGTGNLWPVRGYKL